MRGWIVLGFVLGGCRGHDATSASQGSATLTTTAARPAPPASAATTQRPELPAPEVESTPRMLTADQAFAAEQVDRTWSTVTEQRIRQHVHRSADIECRQTQCRITVSGSAAEVATALDELTELRELAQSLMLGTPETRDGRVVVHAYARFDRPGEN